MNTEIDDNNIPITLTPLEESQRKEYLSAMDIPVWEQKFTTDITPAFSTEETAPVSLTPAIDINNEISPESKWEALAVEVSKCQICEELVSNRWRTVFGIGNRQAQLLVIGEAPGADEDQQGEPFVGRAGQLLNAMLEAINLKREEVYIANILKCRPPSNRDPKPEEAAHCEPFLLQQIELIAPKMILAVGRISAHNLLKTQIQIGKLRGQVHKYGKQRIPLIVTYHPAYLLRSPGQKAESWKDLQTVARMLQQL